MFQIDLKSRMPIYEQVVNNFKRLITTGLLKPGDRVPSVRELAKALTCNPNTVQKAFRELESQGYIYTVPGQGSFISEPPAEGSEAKAEAILEKIGELVYELEFLGITRDKIVEKIMKG